ncbi:MAG: hypothetical protein KDB22_13090 [Planctomycetales bacterium]|nr:hypothetical protein [Planctomycetales bacterium]
MPQTFKYKTLRGLVLLCLLLPVLFGIRWLAEHWRIAGFPSVTFVESKGWVLFEHEYRGVYGSNDSRYFLLDIDKESLKELRSPKPNGLWYKHFGVDGQGKLLAFIDYDRLVVFDPITQVYQQVGSDVERLLGKRYLIRRDTDAEDNPLLVWRDLYASTLPRYESPIADEAINPLVPVPDSLCFYSTVNADSIPDLVFSADTLSTTNIALASDLEMLVLFRLTETGPEQIGRWPVFSDGVRTDARRIACLSLDARFIEVYDAQTGFLETRIAIPPQTLGTDSRPDSWSMSQSTMTLRGPSGVSFTYDLETGREMDLDGAWHSEVYDRLNEEYMTVRLDDYPQTWEPMLQFRNQSSDAVQAEFPFPTKACFVSSPPEGIYSAGERDIMFTTTDMQVIFVSRETGQVTKLIDPGAWLPLKTAAIVIGVLLWMFLWFWHSSESGFHSSVDILLIIAMAVWFLWPRILLTGSPYDSYRPAWQAVEALSISVGILASFHLLRAGPGLFYRLLPGGILVVGVVTGICYLWQDYWFAHRSLIRVAALVVMLPLGAWAIGKWSPFSNSLGTQEHSPFQFTVANIALVTAIAAIFIGFFSRLDVENWTHALQPSRLIAVLFSTLILACLAFATWVTVFSRGRFLLRITCFFPCWFLFTELLVLTEQWWSNSVLGWDVQSFHAAAVGTSLLVGSTFCLSVPYKMRQWQLAAPGPRV